MIHHPALAVTFDFGHTLCDLDTALLSRRLAGRGLDVAADRLEASLPGAWNAYDAAIHAGHGGHPWKTLMGSLLALGAAGRSPPPSIGCGMSSPFTTRGVVHPGDAHLARDLGRARVPVGVVSNSRAGSPS